MSPEIVSKLIQATNETLFMTAAASTIAAVIGIPLGITLAATGKKGYMSRRTLYGALETIVNATRSVPFIILLVAVIPFTRLITGTAIGTAAAIVPLSIAAIPFCARVVETSILDVDKGLIDAVLSMGASRFQVIIKVLVPEAIGGILSGLTLMVINLIGYSAMAGAIGGGGLGDLAIRYGYQRFEADVMVITVVVLIVMVQAVQAAGAKLSHIVTHR
jgi:D-methionine transport system permease protein